MSGVFLDTNVLLYAYVDGEPKRPAAYALLGNGFVISVQSLNEFCNASRRKFGWTWSQVETALIDLRILARLIVTNDVELHELGVGVAQRYKLSIYDSMIVAAALTAGCDRLYSEDMHHGLVIDGRLTIENPFLRP